MWPPRSRLHSSADQRTLSTGIHRLNQLLQMHTVTSFVLFFCTFLLQLYIAVNLGKIYNISKDYNVQPSASIVLITFAQQTSLSPLYRTAAVAEKTAKTAAEVPGKIITAVKGWKLHSYANLPNWMRDNEFLTRGHRYGERIYASTTIGPKFTNAPLVVICQLLDKITTISMIK